MAATDGLTYIDTRPSDWSAFHVATLEACQSLRYEYPGPVEDLHQALLLVPPDVRAG